MKVRYWLFAAVLAFAAVGAKPAPAAAQQCYDCVALLGDGGWTCHTAFFGGYSECVDWYDPLYDVYDCQAAGSGCNELAYVVPTPDGEFIVEKTEKASPPRYALAVFDLCRRPGGGTGSVEAAAQSPRIESATRSLAISKPSRYLLASESRPLSSPF